MEKAHELFASYFTLPGRTSGGERSLCIPSLTGASDAFLAVALAREGLVLAVTPGLPDADRLADDLRLVAPPGVRILEFPPPLDGDKSALGTRLKTIAALRAREISPWPGVVVAAFPALSAPIPAGASASGIPLSAGGRGLGLSTLAARLADLGYRRAPLVEQEGNYSVRGGIVDAWSPGDEFPVRAEFFGDELESLRTFNSATQLSIGRIDACELLPAAEGGEQAAAGSLPTLLDLLPADCALLALEHNDYNTAALRESGAFSALVFTGDPAPRGVPSGDFQTSPLPGFAELGAEEAHHPELFDAARQRLEQHVAAARRRGALVVSADDLSGGFEIGGLIVVMKADRVFTRRKIHYRSNPAFSRGARLSDFDDIEPGEYVVHVDHGVGRYVGSSDIL